MSSAVRYKEKLRIICEENIHIHSDIKFCLSLSGKQIKTDKELDWLESFG